MLKLLNSRKFAVWLLVVLLVILVFSSFLPSHYTLPAERWQALEKERPFLFWLSSRAATPFVVKGPIFIGVSVFLFLSTFVCTVTRVMSWMSKRDSGFRKEGAFSFFVEERSDHGVETVEAGTLSALSDSGWEHTRREEDGKVTVEAQRGMKFGFWGSVVFHAGLLLCFLAAPVTALTTFRGRFIITDGATVGLRDGTEAFEGSDPSLLPDANVHIRDLKGVYEKGRYKVDFGGTMRITSGTEGRDYAFGVNRAVDFRGYQFSLHEFGFAPRIVMSDNKGVQFDFYLNLRHPEEGDHFDLGEGRRLFVLLFPDFFQEGTKLGTKGKDPNNPVLLLRLFEGERQVSSALVKKGGAEALGPYTADFGELRNWANFIVVRDYGVPVMTAGFIIGMLGLFVRFLSNERRIEIDISPLDTGSAIRIGGYSRYYPAFLEKEVAGIADGLRGRGI